MKKIFPNPFRKTKPAIHTEPPNRKAFVPPENLPPILSAPGPRETVWLLTGLNAPFLDIHRNYNEYGDITMDCWTAAGDRDNPSYYHRFFYTYNEQNKIVHITATHFNGDYYYAADYEYDTDGHLIREWVRNKDGEHFLSETYTYNNGLLVKTTRWDRYGTQTHRLYAYDSNGNKIQETFINKDGQEFGKKNYSYDSSNRLIRYDFVDANGKLTSHEAYHYHEQGMLCQEFHNTEVFREFAYDTNGNLLRDETYRYTYNEAGQKISAAGCAHYNRGDSKKYLYDENGNCVKVISLYKDRAPTERTYTYTSVSVPPERAAELRKREKERKEKERLF